MSLAMWTISWRRGVVALFFSVAIQCPVVDVLASAAEEGGVRQEVEDHTGVVVMAIILKISNDRRKLCLEVMELEDLVLGL